MLKGSVGLGSKPSFPRRPSMECLNVHVASVVLLVGVEDPRLLRTQMVPEEAEKDKTKRCAVTEGLPWRR